MRLRISGPERLRQKNAILSANETLLRVFASDAGGVDEALALAVPADSALRRHHRRHVLAEQVER